MIIGYQNVYDVAIAYRFLLKFIVYSACYAMLLSWPRLRPRAKGVDPEGSEGYREIFKLSGWYVSVLIIKELPGILVELVSFKLK